VGEATPCLRPLATFFDHGRPISLPYRNPFGTAPSQMASPKPFQRELELSYPARAEGANAVDFLFFARPEDAERVLRRIRNTPSFFPTGNLEAIGAAIVRWSSTPTGGSATGSSRVLAVNRQANSTSPPPAERHESFPRATGPSLRSMDELHEGGIAMENTVTQFETRWNRLIVELFGLGNEDERDRDEDSDAECDG
jgi:hypothetical protein